MTTRYSLLWPALGLAFLLLAPTASAQDARGPAIASGAHTSSTGDSGGDYLRNYPEGAATDLYITTCGDVGTGYVYGTNCYNDAGKAQCFDAPADPVLIESVVVHMARVDAEPLSYNLAVYEGAPGFNGETGAGPQGAPIYTQSFTTNGLTADPMPVEHTLTEPILMTSSLCFGFTWDSASTGQLLGMTSTSELTEGPYPYDWELWSDGVWHNLNEEWGGNAATNIMIMDVGYSLISSTEPTELPQGLSLLNVYPNPFTERAVIELSVAATEKVSVHVFDMLGRQVATIFEGVLAPGPRSFTLPAENLNAGAYVVRIQGESFTHSQRVALTR